MTKEEARKKLQALGYKAIEDHSVITILISDNKSINSVLKDISAKLKDLGYDSSFGIKKINEGDIIEEIEEIDEIKEINEIKDSLKPPKEESQDFFDEEDDDFGEVTIDEEDMDMLLNEDSIQFSLDDFGLN